MPSFQHFQRQAEQKSNKAKFPNEALSLSGLMQYADSAKKQSFESLCRVHALVKTYRDKIQETSQAMIQTESSLGDGGEVPAPYAAAFALVKESFALHLAALDEWCAVLSQKRESESEAAIKKVKQSGEQLEASLMGLSIPK